MSKRTRKLRLDNPPTFSEKVGNFFAHIVVYCVFPVYWLFRFIMFLKNRIFIEHIRTGDNGIIGPGYRIFYTSRFAWGRLTFIIVIIFIVLFLIFWR